MVDLTLPIAIAEGAYELLDVLGEGGMAIVYRARVDLERFDYAALLEGRRLSRSESRRIRRSDIALGQRYKEMTPHMLRQLCDSRCMAYPRRDVVAIKVLKASVKHNAERFIDEWLGLLGISHPQLVEVYGGGHDQPTGIYYYAMELIENRLSERQVLELPLNDKLEITRQAALGLGCLHEHGMIHRDVKPDNVMCVREPDNTVFAKISDLGIAKDVDRSVELTITEQVMGTPCFMAPELTRGAGEATRSSDVYSLGATLYTWLSGKTPYHGKGLYSILGSLTNGLPPTPIQELVPVPPPLQHLVELLMHQDPATRPQTMDEAITRIDWAREALASAVSGTPSAIPPTPPPSTATSTGHVLVVDDDAQLQRLLRRTLSRMGVEVTIASNGGEALLKLGQHRYNLIVSDINMPTLDGMMLLNILKGQQVTTPVCFLTGGRTPEIVQQASLLGAVAVLDKPVNFPELAALVQRYCGASG